MGEEEINRTVAVGEEARKRNAAAIAKLEAQLAKRRAERDKLGRNATAVTQAVAADEIPPRMASELREQVDSLERRLPPAPRRSGQARLTPSGRQPSSKSASGTPMEELKQALAAAKEALARNKRAFAKLSSGLPPEGVNALLNGGYLPADKMQRAKANLAERDAAADRKTAAGSAGKRRRRMHLSV